MRIVLLAFDNYPAGGIQGSVQRVSQCFDEAGHDVLTWCLRPHPEAEVGQSGIEPVFDWSTDYRMSFRRWWQLLCSLRGALGRARPDVCIGFGLGPQLCLALATLWMSQVRLFGSERSYPPAVPLTPLWRALRRFVVGRLDKLVCQTRRSADWYANHRFLPRSRLAVIPNAFDVPRVTQSTLSTRLSALEKDEVIACIGRMSPEKGYDDALKIFHKVADVRPKARLLLIGDGPLRDELEAFASNLGLTERVCFHPSIKPLSGVWSIVDIFLLTSHFEGMPNALGEAMANGKPCVAFDCPTGPAELISDGVDGFLVPPRDIDLAARHLIALLDDPKLASRIGQAARNIAERYSPGRVCKMWQELIQ